MHLRNTLLEEHSRAQRDKIVAYIGNNEKRFEELMELFFKGEPRIAQRASWPMSYCVGKYPHLILPYLKPLIQQLTKKGVHPALIRNSVRLLQDIPIPEKYQGKLMDACFNFIASPQTPAAIKAFSLTILGNLSVVYPDILPEIIVIIEERWAHETPAFHSRAKPILKKYKPS